MVSRRPASPRAAAAPLVDERPPADPARAIERCLGCKWTLHVLGQVRRGVCRPGRLQRSARGLSAKVLNERLVKLVGLGILRRTSHAEIPPRVEYTLTAYGERLIGLLDGIERMRRDFPPPAD